MIDSQVVAFTAVAAVLAITPGSDTLLVIKNSVSNGARGGQVTTLGVLLGIVFHACISALGLSVILTQSDLLFKGIQGFGAAYLIWLGLQALRSAKPSQNSGGSPSRQGLNHLFQEGLMTNLLNPKVAIFYLAFLPQFISPGDPVLAKSILLALIHNLLCLVWLGGLSVAIGRGRHWLQTQRVQDGLTRISGIVLIGFGLRLAFESR
jgi:RhtB (resistance to homoserine/threonine) family protein